MISFVNREREMGLIEDAFSALLGNKVLPRPIIDFYGVEGIGKTTILREIVLKCDGHQVPCIWANANQNPPKFSLEIINQVRKYNTQFAYQSGPKDPLAQSVTATKTLLKNGPVVILLDAVDTTNEEQIEWIEAMLRNLIEDGNLIVALTSKRRVLFEGDRLVARKLRSEPVQPLDRMSSELYLNNVGINLELQLRDAIYEWTRGYPLAMDVMVEAIHNGLDPRREQDQKALVAIIMNQVINKGVLARVEPSELDWYQRILTVLSIPRRFNLMFMQEIIEEFSPELKLKGDLAYMGLPKRINQATDVLNWNMLRAGFSVSTPIRYIFLLKQKIEQPELYHTMHKFLAQINHRFASQEFGSNQVRYLREYLYHSANTGNTQQLPLILEQAVQDIISSNQESFLQFSEEFSQDEELKEALGNSVNIVLSLIHKHLAELNRQAARETQGPDHIRYLQEYFYHLVHDPEVSEFRSIVQEQVKEVMREEPPAISLKLFEKLAQDDKFKEALGEDFNTLFSLIRKKLSSEG